MKKSSIFRSLAFALVLTAAACRSEKPLPTPTTAPSPPAPTPFTVPEINPVLLSLAPGKDARVELNPTPHPTLSELPPAEYFMSAIYQEGSQFAGRLSLFLYARQEDIDVAWPLLIQHIATPREIDGPGDLTAVDHSDIAFIRCSALVHLKLVGSGPDEVVLFAERVDARLAPLICPPGG